MSSAEGSFWRAYQQLPPGDAFPFFGAVHLAWLAFAVAGGVALCVAYRRGNAGQRLALRRLLAALLVADELFKLVTVTALGQFHAIYLPLHFCSIGIFVCVAYAVKPTAFAAEALYCCTLPGAAIALLFPGWTQAPPFNFIHWHSFTVHTLLLWFPAMLRAAAEIRPSPRRLWRVVAVLALLCPPIYLLDRACGANFFMLGWPPYEPFTSIDARFGRPAYYASLALVAALLWTLQYTAVAVADKRGRAPFVSKKDVC